MQSRVVVLDLLWCFVLGLGGQNGSLSSQDENWKLRSKDHYAEVLSTFPWVAGQLSPAFAGSGRWHASCARRWRGSETRVVGGPPPPTPSPATGAEQMSADQRRRLKRRTTTPFAQYRRPHTQQCEGGTRMVTPRACPHLLGHQGGAQMRSVCFFLKERLVRKTQEFKQQRCPR